MNRQHLIVSPPARVPVWLSITVLSASVCVVVLAVRSRTAAPQYAFPVVTSSLTLGAKPVGLESTGAEPFSVMTVSHVACERCRENEQALKAIAASCAGRPGQSRVVMLTVDPLPDAQAYVKQQLLTFDRLLSFPQRNSLDVREVPTTFALDQSSRVVGLWPGVLSHEDIEHISLRCNQRSVTTTEGRAQR